MLCEFSKTMDCHLTHLQDVFRTTVVAKLTYCAPCVVTSLCLCSTNDHACLDAFLRCSKQFGYCADDVPTILLAAADQSLIKRKYWTINNMYWLQLLLPDINNTNYNLQTWQHNRQLVRISQHVNDSLFIIRMLFKAFYWLCILFATNVLHCKALQQLMLFTQIYDVIFHNNFWPCNSKRKSCHVTSQQQRHR